MFELKILTILISSSFVIFHSDGCTSFYCIQSCGENIKSKGYKLILANNRDEDINRPTLPATQWPLRTSNQTNLNEDLKVYGALDIKNGGPPKYYSSWLGINERGSIGNLLFLMGKTSNYELKRRGSIIGNYLQNSSWSNIENYLTILNKEKSFYKLFNYVHLEMSEVNGDYSLYYLNNDGNQSYAKMNKNKNMFIFGISNSNLERPLKKISNGKLSFEQIIKNYSSSDDKNVLVDSLIQLLQDKTQNIPDKTLAEYLRTNNENIVGNISSINADYGHYWKNARTRTSTVILVDYDNNVEYYEYNLTSWKRLVNANIINQKWELNSFKFKLNLK